MIVPRRLLEFILFFMLWSTSVHAEISANNTKEVLFKYDSVELLAFRNSMLELRKSSTEKVSSSSFIEDKRTYLRLADITGDNAVLIDAYLDVDSLASLACSADRAEANKISYNWLQKILSNIKQARRYYKECDDLAMSKTVREDIQKHDKLFQRLDELINKVHRANLSFENN